MKGRGPSRIRVLSPQVLSWPPSIQRTRSTTHAAARTDRLRTRRPPVDHCRFSTLARFSVCTGAGSIVVSFWPGSTDGPLLLRCVACSRSC